MAFALALFGADLHAAETRPGCGAPDRPWVAVQFSWSGDTTSFEETVLGDLRAGFAGRDIDVCATSSGPAHAPLAVVQLNAASPSAPRVSVEIRDTLTNKRVARDIDLSSVPRDGRAFAVAVATDELVWASWAELALERRAHPQREAPPEVERAIARSLPQARKKGPRLYMRGAADVFSGGQRWFGADGVLQLRLPASTAFSFGAGARAGATVETNTGSVDSRAFTAQAALDYLVLDRPGFELGMGAALQLGWVRLSGSPEMDAVGRSFSSLSFCVGASITAHFQLADPFWLYAHARGGLPARSVEAQSDDVVVTGASGAWGSAALGLGVSL